MPGRSAGREDSVYQNNYDCFNTANRNKCYTGSWSRNGHTNIRLYTMRTRDKKGRLLTN
jgi:hypothetical protein